ncbi:MAG: aminotransferase class I/II-fold pyridoxal phosphate-dependent enzyme [Christensenellaceae bacterium]|jgi:aspartate/methionine/tyrosine aminotransferase
MQPYHEQDAASLQAAYEAAKQAYQAFQKKGLSLDMSRGKPCKEQLDLSLPMLDLVGSTTSMLAENGMDIRNYGVLDGLPEAKRLFAEMLEVTPDMVFVGGNSSLNLMYDAIARAMTFGVLGSKPWSAYETIKFICPSPGYDRHFAITEHFGFELITVPMQKDGPDMGLVKSLVENDPLIKGIWCVPHYSNPTGITYSDDVVRAFAALKPAAPDFRIFWDNAYHMHHLSDTPDVLLNIFEACAQAGSADMVFSFASTSKMTFSGAGISAFVATPKNLQDAMKTITIQTIGFDKIAQLQHARFFPSLDSMLAHMKKHQVLLAPKFDAVTNAIEKNLVPLGIASYTKPNGGYFISFDGLPGTATRVHTLCKEAGLVMTDAGAPFPYGVDPEDKNLRIAPTLPPIEELCAAMELFCLAVKMASLELYLQQ